jgi:polyribonucleotide nucleotidyltransferase
MVEAGANEVPEGVMVALHARAGDLMPMPSHTSWAAEHGKPSSEVDRRRREPVPRGFGGPYFDGSRTACHPTAGGREALDELRRSSWRAATRRRSADRRALDRQKEAFRALYLQDRKRTDLRAFDEIRPTRPRSPSFLASTGTGLFTRGETQVLSSLALADLGLSQRLDTIEPQTGKRYMHHYNFPPYSTGETGRVGAPRRREIGHGALAERALLPVVPGDEEFPYALRIISEVLESNGSSSMASVCGSTLALMDGGVPIKAPVAGVAMGLVKEGEDYVIMSDIQGLEDHMGDMDFKVAGTRDGITALQMDMKITGVSAQLLQEALGQAKTGRLEILDILRGAIAEPRAEVSEFAPRVEVLRIPKEKIGMLIGPGGKTINALQDQFGVNISVEDDGMVHVAGDGAVAKEAAAPSRA